VVLAQHARRNALGEDAALMQLCSFECMGRKTKVKETVNKDFNIAKQFLRPPSKWHPWHVPCLLYPRYVTEINVTQSFTGHGISGKSFH